LIDWNEGGPEWSRFTLNLEIKMQAFSQSRNINRTIMLVMIIISVMLFSWALAERKGAVTPWERSGEYTSRLGGSIDTQIQTLQDRLRSNPEDWQSYSQLGLAYLQKARESGDPAYYQMVEEALGKTLAQLPDDYAATSGMGALALARHQFSVALEWGQRARQINPERAYAYGLIADAQIELGQYSEAVETLQIMVDMRPDMSSYARISYLRELHGDIEGALKMMQSAVDSGIPNLESTAWTRTQLGNLYFNSGDIEGAEIEYLRTLNDWPGYVYALAGLGRVRAAQGRIDEAIQLLIQATNSMPIPDFIILLGELYQADSQRAKAQQQYELVGAIETLYRANGVDMDMEIALFHADHELDLEETVKLARQAYAHRPSIHAADVLAWALYKTGAYEEAQSYSKEALRLGAKDALKLFHAGMIAVELGHTSQARAYLEQALEINPHFSILYAGEAEKMLKMLQTLQAPSRRFLFE
jgi:tetratricopeptide (TPR) repeat protein